MKIDQLMFHPNSAPEENDLPIANLLIWFTCRASSYLQWDARL